VAAIDVQEVAKKVEEAKTDFRPVKVKPMPHLTNRFAVLETSTVGSTRDMLTHQLSVTTELRTEQAMPERPPYPASDLTPILYIQPHSVEGLKSHCKSTW